MAFFGLFRSVEPPDGAVPALEAFADLETASPTPAIAGRRERTAAADADVVAEALGAKVLHSWLQNRHQTLMPLSLNLAVMNPAQRMGLAQILASLLLAGRPSTDAADHAPVLRSWLVGLGADYDVIGSFDRAMKTALPLNVLFETAQSLELTIYTYVAALMASDTRFPVSVLLCDLVQTRFELPTAIVRSAVRRYRR